MQLTDSLNADLFELSLGDLTPSRSWSDGGRRNEHRDTGTGVAGGEITGADGALQSQLGDWLTVESPLLIKLEPGFESAQNRTLLEPGFAGFGGSHFRCGVPYNCLDWPPQCCFTIKKTRAAILFPARERADKNFHPSLAWTLPLEAE